MGQYHYIVNITKREFINPHRLGCGLKLTEQANTDAGTLQALFAALACSSGRGGGDFEEHDWVGRWKGDRIAVVGDYAEKKDLEDEDAELIHGACHDQGRCEEDHGDYCCFDDLSVLAADFLEKEWGFTFVGSGWFNREWNDGRADKRGMAPDLEIGSS